ncbi:farnesol dehydrogenase-like [Vespa mandarinia]|uniref:farnesol dehydrogenase-like n=1 Tax=Vespa mandarinia TaxID=7446 RepID=UPI00161368B0|nr:farnesol dehydrogenase-like [Vespa mandarinia]XP_035728676.1 farnesol dehydrogenase-like [Vespa mandarinia]XP_035728677.1 farnesol dehydrogenase-like [Vespa mandarinia]
MNRWEGKVAVVTGCASGIGKAITCALLEKKIIVVGLDVQNKEEKEMADNRENRYYPLRCDVTNEDDVDAAFLFIKKKFNGVHIMVNNAGVIDFCPIIESNKKTFEKLLNVNVLAMAICTNRAVRLMREKNVEGYIFNINSITGQKIYPPTHPEIPGHNGWNLYPASKHAAVALTHTVRQELCTIKSPIKITSICPGIVKTNLGNRFLPIKESPIKHPSILPEDVADALVYALGTRPEVQITEIAIQNIEEA